MKTEKIPKVIPDKIMNNQNEKSILDEDEKIGKPKKTAKKPITSGAMGIEVLENPHNLLRSWVEIQGKNVRLEHWLKAIKALENERQDLELPHNPLQAKAGNELKSVMADAHNLLAMKYEMGVKAFKDLKDLLVKFRKARNSSHARIGEKPRGGINDLEEPYILLRSWVEIQGKKVTEEHWSKTIKALENEQQDLELQAEAEKKEKSRKHLHKTLIVEKTGQGGAKNDPEILSQQKL